MWVPFVRSFPRNEAHQLFFSGAGPKWGILGGGQKVYVEKVHVLFLFLTCCEPPEDGPLEPTFGAHPKAVLRGSPERDQRIFSEINERSGLKGGGLRRADTQTPTRWRFLARTPTRKRFPLSTVHECLKALFRHASVFKTHRYAVCHCLKEVQKPLRHASVFKARVSTRACLFLERSFSPI